MEKKFIKSLNFFESGLNKEQFKAVTAKNGPLLIIAGAGSGKTRVITYRIVYILSQGISPKEVLALTFTNKAVSEMKDRIQGLLNKSFYDLTISTFHSFGFMFLKENYRLLNYKKNFSIYDENDKIALIKELLIDEGLYNKNISLNSISNVISFYKNNLILKSDFKDNEYKVYELYEERLRLYNSFDFDDLISKPKEILEKHLELRDKYSKRYKYVLIDEFQDTSLIQYSFIKLLISHNNICCVGDDDQSIYSWRGANYKNILDFEKNYSPKEIKLEQNYRSTKNILSAANFLISHNKSRKNKVLWSNNFKNNFINIFSFEDENQEAEFVAKSIIQLLKDNDFKNKNIGILFRINSLFKNMEMALRKEGIKYKVSGGMSFFHRKEIKDIISYLNVIINPKSDYALLRIINIPRRGIGREYLKKIREMADKRKCSIYEALRDIVFSLNTLEYEKIFSRKVIENIEDFVSLIEEYQYKLNSNVPNYFKTIREIIESIEYWGYLVSENSGSIKSAEYKYQNIENFLTMIFNWESRQKRDSKDLNNFLNYIVLQTEEDYDKENINVNLMTIHAAKGLEFDEVFFLAVENNIIPHQKTIEENEDNIEEERRVFYVALTRAKENLTITMANKRKKDKQICEQSPSKFIMEIPKEFLNFKFVDLG